MKRAVLFLCCCVLAAAVPPAAAQSAHPPLRVVVKQCTTGATAAERSAVFEASMPRVKDAVTMAMRFRLFESLEGGKFHRVFIGGFSNLVRSAPNVAGFVFAKHVEQLASGARYRVTVDFTWRDADGMVVRAKQRMSKACKQPAADAAR